MYRRKCKSIDFWRHSAATSDFDWHNQNKGRYLELCLWPIAYI